MAKDINSCNQKISVSEAVTAKFVHASQLRVHGASAAFPAENFVHLPVQSTRQMDGHNVKKNQTLPHLTSYR